MKKQIYLLLFFLLLGGSNMYSQSTATKIIGDIVSPNPMVISGNDMYIGLYYFDKIIKVNIADPSIPPVDVVTGINRPYGLALKENILYVSEYNSNRISKVDLASANPTSEVYVSNLAGPIGLQIKDNYLYVAVESDNKIGKIDITQPTPTFVDVITAQQPFDIQIVENDIYFTERHNGRLSKYKMDNSTTTSTIIAQGLNYPSGLTLHGNQLYIAEAGAKKISKFNTSDAIPTLTDAIYSSEFSYPSGLSIKDNTIYITDFNASSLFKSELGNLSVAEHTLKSKISIYPNPAKETLTVTNSQSKDYKIFDMAGKLILSGSLENNSINIGHLSKGTYMIQVGDLTQKFIKE